ncbi:hypothetical protein PE067_12445 [Paracoccus sp. DMF-8]|nr:hypothetical protein [Paracoccus sp. DMF-8]MDF3606866.1 hypothetical protein [Paracoccus sp. DMF-8]
MKVSATNTAQLPDFVGRCMRSAGAPVLMIERTYWADAVAVTVSRQYFREGYTLNSTI